MQFFDPVTRRIVISRYYSPTTLKFNYHYKAVLRKDPELLPITVVATLNKTSDSTAIEPLFAKPERTIFELGLPQEPVHNPPDSTSHDPPIIVIPESITQPKAIPPVKKGYAYVPHYKKALKDVNSKFSTSNIIPEPRKNQNEPKGFNLAMDTMDDEDIFLSEVVPVIDAMTNPDERDKWKEAMAEEFNSLVSKNMGTLVPAP
ncbi:hypothetical protein O181_096297 [Austropuccinia psidii MF-1]|uniref:Uncharacterized protein n=1 Tax=Austropuccinia psidii MF-1 TaxID=1389203 RepID=A0A9Q3PDC9_9BASI|nr:hypothetical protein [Austropuccinia psidii MF-1]